MTRKATNKLLEMMDEGIISAEKLAEACLKYMSEREVAHMAHVNEFLLDEDYDDSMDEDHDAAMASVGFDGRRFHFG